MLSVACNDDDEVQISSEMDPKINAELIASAVAAAVALDEYGEEYDEDLEPLEEDDSSRVQKESTLADAKSPKMSPKRVSKNRTRKFKNGPDYRWESNSKEPNNADFRWETSAKEIDNADFRWESNSRPSSDSAPKSAKTRRSGIERSASFDWTDTRNLTEYKRHSWDCASKVAAKSEPDFRWDKIRDEGDDDDALNHHHHKKKNNNNKSGKNAEKRRKTPRRTKSDLTDYDRPGSRNPRVKFCLRSNVCFEVPRAPKEMKADLFYSKREIKEFKAENRQRKQREVTEKLQAQMAEASSFHPVGANPIATC